MDRATVFKEKNIDGFGEVEFVDGATEKLWKQWGDLIASEKWKSDDVSMRTITPHLPSTRSVFARRKDSGDLVGTVTWNEYDGVTFIGIFVVIPEVRGKGVGGILWDRATERFPPGRPQILRGVPAMQSFYQQRNGMDGWENQNGYIFEWRKLGAILKSIGDLSNCFLKTAYVSSLTEEQFEKLLAFDRFITKRDRSAFLKKHYALGVTEGVVFFNEQGDVCAVASGSPTNSPDDHLYKIAPVYARNTQQAALVTLKMVEWFGDQDEGASIVIHILDGMRGAREFAPIFQKEGECKLVGKTLFNGGFENPIERDLVFVANNNSAHFDA